jgi:hypothetical protein
VLQVISQPQHDALQVRHVKPLLPASFLLPPPPLLLLLLLLLCLWPWRASVYCRGIRSCNPRLYCCCCCCTGHVCSAILCCRGCCCCSPEPAFGHTLWLHGGAGDAPASVQRCDQHHRGAIVTPVQGLAPLVGTVQQLLQGGQIMCFMQTPAQLLTQVVQVGQGFGAPLGNCAVCPFMGRPPQKGVCCST